VILERYISYERVIMDELETETGRSHLVGSAKYILVGAILG